MVTVRLLVPDDTEQFKALRLLAVDNAPTAIWPTREEELARPIEEIAGRIRSTPTQAVFGAFERDVLIDIAGVRRESLRQVSHKTTTWGVFFNPSNVDGESHKRFCRQRQRTRPKSGTPSS